MTRGGRLGLLAFGLSAANCGKDPSTGIVVEVWSNLAVPAEMDSLQVQILDVLGAETYYLPLSPVGGDGTMNIVKRFGTFPRGAPDSSFDVRVAGMLNGGEMVAQTARVTFAPGQVRLLSMTLDQRCRGRESICAVNGNTCVEGFCRVRVRLDLPPYFKPTPSPPRDAAPPADARPPTDLPIPPDLPPTFSVSGVVQGLRGTLVLQNGVDILALGADGPFTFRARLPNGAVYDVRVSQTPPGQNCAVAEGRGIIAGRDVTNVVVSCSSRSFTIGGAVSGLKGTGLVLKNNGAETLTVMANGTFTFPTPVPDGSPYAVTIDKQPSNPAQVCTVMNGSGFVSGGNVTTVSIACAAPQYTVGVTVSGLQGSGLVLQLNGAANLSVPMNGDFTFATPVADGSMYAVTVASQPANPAQTCTVTRGTGTIMSANVTGIAVACSTGMCAAVGQSSSTAAVNKAQVTLSHNVSGTDPVLVVGIAARHDNGVRDTIPNVTSITYGTVALVRLGRRTDGFYEAAELWGVAGPPAGSGTIVVNFDAPVIAVVVGATTILNVSPVGAFGPVQGTIMGPQPSITVDALTTDLVVDVLSVGGTAMPTPTAPQALLWRNGGGVVSGQSSARSGAGPGTPMRWTSTVGNWVQIGVAVKASNGCN